MKIEVGTELLAIRPELMQALEAAWLTLATPGTWWTGAGTDCNRRRGPPRAVVRALPATQGRPVTLFGRRHP